MDTTETVTNTFTVGNIDIDLKEHDLVGNNLDMNKEVTEEDTYKIIPGTSQPKDPFVRVESGSEACWVFITVEEVNDAEDYITYSIDTGVWTVLDATNYPGVYYKEMNAITEDAYLNILTGKTVSYSEKLTKSELDNLYVKDANGNPTMTMLDETLLPKLQFTAYAIQKTKANGETFTAAQAWQELNPNTNA